MKKEKIDVNAIKKVAAELIKNLLEFPPEDLAMAVMNLSHQHIRSKSEPPYDHIATMTEASEYALDAVRKCSSKIDN